MRTLRSTAIILLAIALGAGISAFVKANKVNEPGKGFAIIELYTSEGCSSCPAADQLIAKIQKESYGKPVYILAYHVDYWDRLGWKDQFSNANFSKRQKIYASYLKIRSIYTPQVIVNGQTELVGSEEGKLRASIAANLSKAAVVDLNLQIDRINPKTAGIKYTVSGPDKNAVLQLAVVQSASTSKIAAGENSGRTLSHVQIVRELKQYSLNNNAGIVNIDLPQGYSDKGYEIIGFLQDKSNGAIIAAAQVGANNQML